MSGNSEAEGQNHKSGPPIIQLENLCKSYGSVEILKRVNLEIAEGEFVAITGASGNGKSTLMHLMGGLDQPSSGNVIVAGKNLKSMKDKELSKFRNQTIGFVFQFFYLQPFMTLKQNIEIACMPNSANQSQMEEIVNRAAASVNLDEKLEYYPRQLSGGQIQRAAIARAVANNPKIILADEPTGNLDEKNSLATIDLFRGICEAYHTTIVLVTHDTRLAQKADRIIQIKDGVIL